MWIRLASAQPSSDAPSFMNKAPPGAHSLVWILDFRAKRTFEPLTKIWRSRAVIADPGAGPTVDRLLNAMSPATSIWVGAFAYSLA